MAEPKKVTITALTELRAKGGKKIPVGKTTEVLESTANILVKNKQAEIVKG